MANEYLDKVGLAYFWGKLKAYFQEKLVSGTNIKTINNESLLGSGNIIIQGGGGSVLDFYPVGSYYETSDTSFNPNTSWGGTWALEIEGQVHVSSGTNYLVGGALTDTSDGGNADAIVPYHNHSVNAVNTGNQSASHTHGTGNTTYPYFTISKTGNTNEPGGGISGSGQYYPYVTTASGWGERNATGTQSASHAHSVPAHDTNYAGTSGEEIGGNMQPYIVVNRWHRTA